TGMILATLGILVANRLLPEALPGRGDWEKYAFWGTWCLALMHAVLRSAPVSKGLPNPAWREQSLAIAIFALAAVGLNWLTTGDHLLRTLSVGYWPVAGIDLVLLATAGVSLWVARRLKRRATASDARVTGRETARV
ncbi:MAG: PepSY domain-containing protein, partial [Achromobacter sp.]|nr:PepSY domain-containing protein [Achromobacter sp.]